MVSYIDDKIIERETPVFRQNLALLNERTKGAGISLEFDADRAMARTDEGFDHRYEIYASILKAKRIVVPAKSEAKGVVDVLNFMRQITTLAELALTQETGRARVPAANASENFDDVQILGDAQETLKGLGSSLKIDYDLVTGKGAEAGAYRVRLADELSKAFDPQGTPTRPNEVSMHPAYDDVDELLALAQRMSSYYRHPGQGNIL